MRLAQNPNHYKLDGNTVGRNLDDRIEQICARDIGLLQKTNLVSSSEKLKATEFGEAMARYYVKFETMKVLLSLEPRAKMSEIVRASQKSSGHCADHFSCLHLSRLMNSMRFVSEVERRTCTKKSTTRQELNSPSRSI